MLDRSDIKYQALTKFNVIAPTGAFGNHLRWLLVLDPKFSFIATPTKQDYAIFAGPSWPSYENYCQSNFENIPANITNEIHTLKQEHTFLNVYRFVTVEEKVKFITDYVYNDLRSWHNWLANEFEYVVILRNLINFSHQPTIVNNNKTVVAVASPEFALNSYLKFNSSLNNLTISGFCKDINDWYTKVNVQPNVIPCRSDQLFSEVLDKTLYTTLVEFLELSDLYTEANYIHKLWYNLHKKSEREFVQYVNNCYN